MLHLIFTKVPEKILEMTPQSIIESILCSKEHFEMFILIIISLIFVIVSFIGLIIIIARMLHVRKKYMIFYQNIKNTTD